MHTRMSAIVLLGLLPALVQAEAIYIQQDDQEVRLTNLPQETLADSERAYQLLVGEIDSVQKHPSSRLASKPLPYADAVARAALSNQVEPALLHAIMQAESSGDPNARSARGASGLMQLMPATARQFRVSNPLDPVQNLQGAARYLRTLNARFNGDLKLVLAAYNAGPAAVLRHGNQVPPYTETQQYVPKVLQRYRQLRSEKID